MKPSGGPVSSQGAVSKEEEFLQRRLAQGRWIASLFEDSRSVAAQTLAAYTELLEEALLDVAVEAHREARTGLLPALPMGAAAAAAAAALPMNNGSAGIEGDEPPAKRMALATSEPQNGEPNGGSGPVPAPKGGGYVDAFGQSHPPVATEQVTCMQCGRKVAAGKFAPHLERCLGKGRTGRAASRRGAAL